MRRVLWLIPLLLALMACEPGDLPGDLADANNTGPRTNPTEECDLLPFDDGGFYQVSDCVVHGQVNVTNDTLVSFTDVLFDGTASGNLQYAVNSTGGFVTLDYSEVRGAYLSAGLFADSMALDHTKVWHLNLGTDGMKVENSVTINHSFINVSEGACLNDVDDNDCAGGHVDGFQIQAPITNVHIDHSTIIGGNNAAFQLSPEINSANSDGPVVMTNNVFACDNPYSSGVCAYTVRVYSDQGHIIDGVELTGNTIFDGEFGPLDTNYSSWTNEDNQHCSWQLQCEAM